MKGHDCEDFDDRQSRAPYFYNPPDFQHGHYGDARENYTPSSFNPASTQDIEPQESSLFDPFEQPQPTPINGSPSCQQEIEHTGDSFIPQEYKRIPARNNLEFQAQEKNYGRTPNRTQNGHSSIPSSPIKRPDEIAENLIHIGPLNVRYEGGRPSSVQAPKKGQKGKISQARVILGADGKPKGSVRFVRGHMEHQEVNDNIWRSAIYHEELRDKLIAEASLLGEYDHPRERGIAANDVTSFLPSQKAWGPGRDLHWPNIKDNVLHRFERKGYPIPDYQLEVWYYEGKVVLDSDNHAILNYEVLPATLSSELSGRDMEAMKRLDLRIGRKDFRARMPSTIFTKDKNKPQSRKPLHTLSAIGMRTTRFRKENGLISWTEREGGNNIRQYLLKRMPRANIDANSTHRMSIPSLFEQEDSRSSNRGQHLERAGGRALSNDIRNERERKNIERLERLRTADIEAKKQVGMQSGGKRKRDNVLSDVEEGSQRSKRIRNDIAAVTTQSISNQALLPQASLFPRLRVRPELYLVNPAPPIAGRKRTREESLNDEANEQERPLKRHNAHLIYGKPTASLIKRPEVPSRSVHCHSPGSRVCEDALENRVIGSYREMNGGSLASQGLQTQQGQTRYHQAQENRPDGLDDLIDFRIGEPEVSITPSQSLHSLQAQLEVELGRWFAENVENAEDSNPGDAESGTSMSAQGSSSTTAASSVSEACNQGVQLPANSDATSVEGNDIKQITTVIPVQDEPAVSETTDDLFDLFYDEDEYELKENS
ncbi:hypothetical protein MMC22_000958 [Lobaria immixta]|nr:hypothetical protein [Lobaria immixta]